MCKPDAEYVRNCFPNRGYLPIRSMRINTSGNQEYREKLYERTADQLDENTKTGAIDSACIHVENDIEGKEEAIEYLANELPPRKLERVADMLSTPVIDLSVNVEIETTPD